MPGIQYVNYLGSSVMRDDIAITAAATAAATVAAVVLLFSNSVPIKSNYRLVQDARPKIILSRKFTTFSGDRL